MRLLTICPTFNRPELCKRMVDSFNATKSVSSELFIYTTYEDPQIDKYKELFTMRDKVLVGPRRPLVKVLNYVSCELYPDVLYYQEINDDHIFRTPGWDNRLIEVIEQRGRGWGLACGNDLMTNAPWEQSRHPSGALISGNIVRTLGHFVWPELDHLFTDTYLRDISEGINSLFRLPDVVIEHCHYLSNKAEFDSNYKTIYDKITWRKAYGVYKKWIRDNKELEIKKIKEARRYELQKQK